MTAMQQLINEIVEHLTYDDDLTEDSRIALETIRLRCLGKLEMEKQQIIDAAERWKGTDFAKKYYAETYGSKGSETTSSQTTSDKWKEYQDWLNEVPQISDEEIEKASENAWSDYEYEEGNLYSTTFKGGWKLAIKWYREQLKQRQ